MHHNLSSFPAQVSKARSQPESDINNTHQGARSLLRYGKLICGALVKLAGVVKASKLVRYFNSFDAEVFSNSAAPGVVGSSSTWSLLNNIFVCQKSINS